MALASREYDSDGNLVLHATPSAVEGYSVQGYNLVPTYRSEGGQYNLGLIHVYDYYDSTTTDSGGAAVKGFKQYDKIKKGRDSTPIKLRKYEYTQASYTLILESSSSSSSGAMRSCSQRTRSTPSPRRRNSERKGNVASEVRRELSGPKNVRPSSRSRGSLCPTRCLSIGKFTPNT